METSDHKPRHSVLTLVVLVFDLLLATCACLELAFVVQVFGEMFRDFAFHLPTPTQILFKISNTLVAFHGVGFTLLLCFMLWMIMRTYLSLHRRGDQKILDARLSIIFVSFIVLIGIMTATMLLPIFTRADIVGW